MYCTKHGNVAASKETSLVIAAIPRQFMTFESIGSDPSDRVSLTVCLLCLTEWYKENFPAVLDQPPKEKEAGSEP